MSMNIYSPPGTKIVYNNPEAGYDHDQQQCSKLLQIGNIYTVAGISVYSYASDLYLKEFPGIIFNTVMFDNIEDGFDYNVQNIINS